MTPEDISPSVPLLKRQFFGVEIECTGITREAAAKAIGELFSSEPRHIGGSYDSWEVTDPAGKAWKIMSDSSILAQVKRRGEYQPTENREYQVEMVTPKLEYAEMEKLQEVVRVLRRADAVVNDSCGLHVHVDGANHDAKSLKNLLSIMYSKEDLLFKALQTPESRVTRWCKPVREDMLEDIRKKHALTIRQLERSWYGTDDPSYSRGDHYNWSRYSAANLHSLFYRGTVEFRCFNSSLHAGEVRAFAVLALAISAQAIEQKTTQMHKTRSENEKFTFRTWLLRLGLIGPEYASCREHLLKHLSGDPAWRYDRSKYPANQPREPER